MQKKGGDMKKTFFAKAVFVSIFLLLALLALPQANTSAKEITVKVGLATDQTGPLATDGRKGVDAWLWYEEYLNKEKGGWKDIKGNTVTLKVLYGDTGFTPAKTISLYKKFKSEGIVAIANGGSVSSPL